MFSPSVTTFPTPDAAVNAAFTSVHVVTKVVFAEAGRGDATTEPAVTSRIVMRAAVRRGRRLGPGPASARFGRVKDGAGIELQSRGRNFNDTQRFGNSVTHCGGIFGPFVTQRADVRRLDLQRKLLWCGIRRKSSIRL